MLLQMVRLGLTDVAEIAYVERHLFPYREVNGQFVTEIGDCDVGKDYVVVIFSSVEQFIIGLSVGWGEHESYEGKAHGVGYRYCPMSDVECVGQHTFTANIPGCVALCGIVGIVAGVVCKAEV